MGTSHQFCCLVLISLTVINKTATAQNVTETSVQSIASPVSTPVLSTTRKPVLQTFRMPCSCFEGQCGCCTGYILDRLNQKACMNMTYEPEEFAVSAVGTLNGKVFYRNTISGKNPPPICVRVPRLNFIKFCVEFSNVYVADRNVHLCIDAEANWEDLTLLEWSFDCVRMGLTGVAVVSPEDGGGLPANPIDTVDQTDEDYDDSARNNPNELGLEKRPQKIIFHQSLRGVENKSPKKGAVTVKRLKNGNYFVSYLGNK